MSQQQAMQSARAAAVRARKALEEAEREAGRVETDIASARARIAELSARMLAGDVATDLASEASKLKALEAARTAALARIADARDEADNAESELEEQTVASASNFSDEDVLRTMDEVEGQSPTESIRLWIQTARDLIRATRALQQDGVKIQIRGRTLNEVLGNALKAHQKLLSILMTPASSLLSAGHLLVPSDASLESRGTSAGGKAKYHWEVPAEYNGKRGRAYIELYIDR